jgi:hypothetical protein
MLWICMGVICFMLVSVAVFEGYGISYRDKCRLVSRMNCSAVR